MYHAHTPADWAQMLCFATSGYAALSVPYFLTVDADLTDFDPRPGLARLVESGRVDALLVAVANAKHSARTAAARARHIPRDAAISLAALLLLLSAPGPEATR
ncbi:hypothetical protein [Streptomyces griseorubiginosus]|uniref:hypothetical protein n=1 Tax=Streptomyces griseorubiginosus TaxID=67304 RepID=UPI0036EA06B1